MLLIDEAKIVAEADGLAARGATVNEVLTLLRGKLSLDAFGLLLIGLPRADLPALSKLLPRMASDETQRNFTGNSGEILLGQTVSFVRALAYNYAALRNCSLSGARIMDYGCGYGRITRMLYYFANPEAIWAVDPWDLAVSLCRDAGMLGNIAQSDYLPASLPAPEAAFDVMFAFSVFTHTSRNATDAALSALRRHIAPNGLLAITIRPEEYWAVNPEYAPQAAAYQAKHAAEGFAFAPHGRDTVEGEATYGDTSMTLDFLAANYPDWRIEGADWALVDPYQRYVFLTPA
ncbi:class I SAM-dependent methyltransferase [Phenylobacterium ferrooxidans]|uniref:Class I SAM-dependent methyltransferase n=1 Tax=Phenylobacterium ferrooxidans TaxID=2982689 RepID=A0ABW6CS57_9CAUL